MSTKPATPPASTEEQKAQLKKLVGKEKDVRALTTATSELLFVLLPFIVIGIGLAHRGEIRTIFFIPEWSIVSAVIVGQTIVKVASASVGNIHVKKHPIILIMTILLVCLLVPILSILAIVLTSPNISTTLAATQAVFFVLSTVVFWGASAIETYVEQSRP
ncbi:MAG TPA: hypothetical protein VN950_04965 [Terriglobales bacterium]|nr:hypothetical protein [Terriglobales bacterium]